MAKFVRYNGGTISYYGCSKPDKLVVGKEYKVIAMDERDCQTDYVLEGVNGSFNSVWFDEIATSKVTTFMAFSNTIPVVGRHCNCSRVEITNGQCKLVDCSTSTVKAVQNLGDDIYQVRTRNSTYIIQIY